MSHDPARFAWVLNLDADLELSRSEGSYTPTAAVRRQVAANASALAASLLAEGDIVIDESSPVGVARGFIGRAFCPTPRALALMRRAGAEPEAHPGFGVLRAVNDRAFSASLGQTLPGAAYVRDVDRAVAHVSSPLPEGIRASSWRVKRSFGMAGRGQRKIAPSAVSSADVDAIRAVIVSDGGVQIEPSVIIDRELGRHGFLARDGSLMLGAPVVQRCDEHGQWLQTIRATNDDPTLSDEVVGEVARALRLAGYVGPFGVDGFVYLTESGPALQPRSEINARYSMGYGEGLRPARRAL